LDVRRFTFIELRTPANSAHVATLRDRLDPGESEAIALALELGARTVLVDDLDARGIAGTLGLRVVGALGVLALARRRGLAPPIGPLIAVLQQDLKFRVSKRIIEEAIKASGDAGT
jgi:predicted nucleic acid-binding protein